MDDVILRQLYRQISQQLYQVITLGIDIDIVSPYLTAIAPTIISQLSKKQSENMIEACTAIAEYASKRASNKIVAHQLIEECISDMFVGANTEQILGDLNNMFKKGDSKDD